MDYTPEIIRSRRRTLSVEISRDLRVIVRAPLRLPQREIARFLSERAGWIEEHLARARCSSIQPARSERKRAISRCGSLSGARTMTRRSRLISTDSVRRLLRIISGV